MSEYLITLNNGRTVRIQCAGDPTNHPAFTGRVVSYIKFDN